MPRSEGGGISFESFFRAIAAQESGGNYNAVNSRTGASGKYQIMPANIGPWSEKYLGRRVSVAEFRRSPELQERLARAVLSSYFEKWGARGAASAWYSGSPKGQNSYKRFRPNEPSIGEYVDSVMRRAGAGGAQGTLGKMGAAPPLKHTVIDRRAGAVAPTATPQFGDPMAFLSSSTQPGLAAPTFDGTGGGGVPFQAAPVRDVGAAPAAAPAAGGGSNDLRDKIVAEAMKYIGTPYVWGGTGPKGFDCSGILKYVFGKYGVDLPRISNQQANYGKRVDVGSLRPGDFVAWDNSSRNNGADHIALYIGNGQVLEAPRAGTNVRVRSIGNDKNAWGVSLNI